MTTTEYLQQNEPNCVKCHYRHKDNGNCTAVGGFCTAVPAAYCPLIPELFARAEAAESKAEAAEARAEAAEKKAADVRPVVRGRWRWVGQDKWNDCYECSQCGKMNTDNSNFCPNCGAEMNQG